MTMKTLITASLLTLMFTLPASAAQNDFTPEDKYLACLIGRSIIKIHAGTGSDAAQKLAFASCGTAPAGMKDWDDLGDYIKFTVQPHERAKSACDDMIAKSPDGMICNDAGNCREATGNDMMDCNETTGQ
jgi:hypothetical protein